MKIKFTLLLAWILKLLFFSSFGNAELLDNAPIELKAFIESDFNSIHFDSMKTHAVPLKILLTALVLEGRHREWIDKESLNYQEVFKRAGLYYPTHIIYKNKEYRWNSSTTPLGLVQKNVGFYMNAEVPFVNLSCIACHGKTAIDQFGFKTTKIIAGGSSDSFNPELYVDLIYRGTKLAASDWGATFLLIKKMFPETSLREQLILKTLVKYQINQYLKKQASLNRGTPFLNGAPGLTNGVSSLKYLLGLDPNEDSGVGFTSIPALGDRGFRSSLLNDGFYSIKNEKPFVKISKVTNENLNNLATITALFTIPSMGQTIEGALQSIKESKAVVVTFLSNYQTPKYPEKINFSKAKKGFVLYQKNCMNCHGLYEYRTGEVSRLISFPNRLSPQAEMKTDDNRWKAISNNLMAKIAATELNRHVSFNQSFGYVAPVLEGLWASAPYLHNGSVPSLWHLMRPSSRPISFHVGHQDFDLEKVGIKNKENKYSLIYDVSLPGHSSAGHEKEFEKLKEKDLGLLLEFLKTL